MYFRPILAGYLLTASLSVAYADPPPLESQLTLPSTIQTPIAIEMTRNNLPHRLPILFPSITSPDCNEYQLPNLPQLKAPHRPRPVFRNWSGSEVEALLIHRTLRLQSDRFLDWMKLGNQIIPITELAPVEVNGYMIQDQELASRSGLPLEIPISESQIRSNSNHAELLIALLDPLSIEIVKAAINPDYEPRPISTEESDYLDFLRNIIDQEICQLGTSPEALAHSRHKREFRWYTSPMSLNGQLNVNSCQRDRKQFNLLLNSICENTENEFLQQMVRLSTSFELKKAEAKTGFIETFTYLFITKEFPSLGIRQKYCHYILRCGTIN